MPFVEKTNRDIFEVLVREIRVSEKDSMEITGVEGEYVRPPYESWDKSFEEELNMIPVLWTIDPPDWCSSNPAYHGAGRRKGGRMRLF